LAKATGLRPAETDLAGNVFGVVGAGQGRKEGLRKTPWKAIVRRSALAGAGATWSERTKLPLKAPVAGATLKVKRERLAGVVRGARRVKAPPGAILPSVGRAEERAPKSKSAGEKVIKMGKAVAGRIQGSSVRVVVRGPKPAG
jgi:hypothetical protein